MYYNNVCMHIISTHIITMILLLLSHRDTRTHARTQVSVKIKDDNMYSARVLDGKRRVARITRASVLETYRPSCRIDVADNGLQFRRNAYRHCICMVCD